MGGGNTTTTNQSQNSTSSTNPYGPTAGLLSNIISGLNGVGTSPTPGQSTASNNLVSAANSIPDLSNAVTGVTSGALSGDPTGLLNSSYANLNNNIGSIASGSVDPTQNPAINGILTSIQHNTVDPINAQFAAAGRDGSPANSYSAAAGAASAEAPYLFNQYNQDMQNKLAAAGTLYNAGNTTAGNITNTQQTGLSDAGSLPGLITQPAQTALNAATTQAQLPLSTLQQIESLGLPIASAFGTTNSSGSGTATSTQQTNPLSTIIGGLLGGAGLIGKFLPSDIRVKENAEPVGMLNDGQTVWKYNYIGDDTPHIGLMAQEVERVAPEAVSEFGGIKAVDYDKATKRARNMGGLLDMAA